MPAPLVHNKLLNDAAREVLLPLGLVQKGRSRVWFDDHGWWVTTVEFQPSSWSRGSYLNVGAAPLWSRVCERLWTHGAGDRVRWPAHGGGTTDFAEYSFDEEWRVETTMIAQLAAEEVAALRERFSSYRAWARFLTGRGHRDQFDVAIVHGLDGRARRARKFLAAEERDLVERLAEGYSYEPKKNREWAREEDEADLDLVRRLIGAAEDAAAFRSEVIRLIRRCREVNRLDPARPVEIV